MAEVVGLLTGQHPGADTELVYRNAFELLIATILSAQTTDLRVNQVTPGLFERWPDAAALGRAPLDEVERAILPTGFFRQKAKTIVATSAALVDRHGGEVPETLEALTTLPGVGRKTANVVLGHAFGVVAFPVDRHVLRVANRLGIACSDHPEEVERQVTAALDPGLWTLASDTLILHGRRICTPRPRCERCQAARVCAFRAGSGARRAPGRRPPLARSGRQPARHGIRKSSR